MLLQIQHTRTENSKNYFKVINLETGNSAPETELESPYDLKIIGDSYAKFMPKLKWYLENYLSMPIDVNARVANNVEETVKSWGLDCFSRLFTGNAAIWFNNCLAGNDLKNLRLEIASDNPAVHGWIWEALYSPDFGYLAQQCHIGRRLPGKYELPPIKKLSNKALNILYIIARPKDETYVGYNTLLRPLLNYLTGIDKNVNIDLLRPPTFEKLKQVLKEKPGYYNIVHFDGHGNYGDKRALPMPGTFSAEGLLAFEDDKGGSSSIGADAIATLLLEHKIPVMILNACRSGMIDENASDPFSSVAAALLKAGVRSVIAMSYSLYVSGAKQFVPAMYRELFSSCNIGEAVRIGRQAMFLHKKRTTFLGETELSDWLVPVVYQQTENKENLLPKLKAGGKELYVPLNSDFDFDSYGFIGRERYIYILEGVLQRSGQPAILITGMSGIGKSTFAKGFIHWLAQTGGLSNEPVWVSFEGIADVQSQLDILAMKLLSNDVMLLDKDGRFQELIKEFKKTPYFIVFDNLESATVETYISNAEAVKENRKLISNLLKSLHGGKTRIIMTSRLAENWLPAEYSYQVEMKGFEGEELWEFCSKVFRNLDLNFDDKNEAYQKFVSEALGGNPVAIRTILICMKHEMTFEAVIEKYTTGYNWLENEKNDDEKDEYTKKIRASFSVLKSHIATRFVLVLHVLALCEQYVLVNQIVLMLDKQNVDEDTVIDCLALIESAGLCTNKGDELYQLHPALVQCLKQDYPSNEQIERTFTEMFTHVANTLAKKTLDAKHINIIFNANIEKALKFAKLYEMIEYEMAITNYFASVCYAFNQFSKAAEWYCLLVGIYERCNDEERSAHAYLMLGAIALAKKDFTAAEKWYNKCLEISLKLNIAEDLADIYHQLGMIALEQYDFKTAEEWYNKSLEINPNSVKSENADVYHEFGRIAQQRRDFKTAEMWFNKALDISLKNGNEHMAARTYLHLGINAAEQHDDKTAYEMYTSCKRIVIKLGDEYGLSKVYHELGLIAKNNGEFSTAEDYFNKSLEIDIKLGDEAGIAIVYNSLGSLAEEQNDLIGAENWYNKALEFRKKLKDIHDIANVYNNLGIVARKRHDYRTAEELCLKSLEFFTELDHENGMACVCHSLGEIAEAKNEFTAAVKWYEKSLGIDLRLGNDYEASETFMQLCKLCFDSQDYSAEAFDTLQHLSYLFLDAENTEMLEQSIKQIKEFIAAYPQYKENLNQFISYLMDKEHDKNHNISITMLMDIMNGDFSEAAKKSVINRAERIINDGDRDKMVGNMQAAYRAYSSAGYLFNCIKYAEGVAGALRCTGILYETCNEPDAALDFYQQALGCTDYDCLQKAFTLAQLGVHYKKHGSIQKALDYTQDALNIFISLKDEKFISSCKQQIKEIRNCK